MILGIAGIAAAAAGFLVGPALLEVGGKNDGAALRAAGFPDLEGRMRRLDEWQGRVLVCNFWATWCAPCREEIPLLIAARERYAASGAEIVGIAIDVADKVREFASSFKIPYPILLADANGIELMRQLGNGAGGLPYTVVADRRGLPLERKLGAFKAGELDNILQAALKS